MTLPFFVNSKITSTEVKQLQGQPSSRPGHPACHHLEGCISQKETGRLREVRGLHHTSMGSLGLPRPSTLREKRSPSISHVKCQSSLALCPDAALLCECSPGNQGTWKDPTQATGHVELQRIYLESSSLCKWHLQHDTCYPSWVALPSSPHPSSWAAQTQK